MTKEEAIKEINTTQDYYIEQLRKLIKDNLTSNSAIKEINFTSPTGTGKTIMMAKAMNLMPEYFFVVTSLSRGSLYKQIDNTLKKFVEKGCYLLYGLQQLTSASILKPEEVLEKIPTNKKIIWFRDEGHIATNRWYELLFKRSDQIVNFSATNKNSNGIQCNFSHTMMLRTVKQSIGTPKEAIQKLISVKKQHKKVAGYNPCALFRIIDNDLIDNVIKECNKNNLKYINIIDEEFDISELCLDDCDIDVIINKFKITEGIDLRRCHVIYIDNKPGNEATVVQVIGRSRRNALLWNEEIDIMSPENETLLKETRMSYVYYNSRDAIVTQNKYGEFILSLADRISIESLKENTTVYVENGQLTNGLYVIELENQTGYFNITRDKETKFNIINNPCFYTKEIEDSNNYTQKFDLEWNANIKTIYFKDNISDIFIKKIEFLSSSIQEKIRLLSYLNNLDITYYNDQLIKVYKSILYDFSNDNNDEYFVDISNIFMIDVDELKKEINNIEFNDLQDAYNTYLNASRELGLDKIFYVNSIDLRYELGKPNFAKKYIKKMEVVDLTDYFNVEKKLNKIKYIKRINRKEFIYSKHPLSNYLHEIGIWRIKELRSEINKNNDLCSYPKSKWLKILSKINRVEDIDKFDFETLNIHQLSEMFKLDLKDEQINRFSKLKYPIVTIDKFKTSDTYEILKPDDYRYKYEKSYPQTMFVSDFVKMRYKEYTKVTNDKELAIIGPDTFKILNGICVADSSVTAKIHRNCKFNTFISEKYNDEIEIAKPQLFTGKNDFQFNSRCNSCLGFCVEYYAKYILYGDKFLGLFPYVNGNGKEELNNAYIVRKCLEKYREEMVDAFGEGVEKIIPSISMKKMVDEEFYPFVKTVVELGKRTADFIKRKMNITSYNFVQYDPVLSVKYVSALADLIIDDTIIDIKCTNYIDIYHIKQVLSYHYLSTKRSDLYIKKVLVYDASSDKYIEIAIEEKNLKTK